MVRMRIFVVVLDQLRLECAGHITRMEDECIPEKLLNGKFCNKKQMEEQEQDGRTSSGGTHHRS